MPYLILAAIYILSTQIIFKYKIATEKEMNLKV